MSEQNDPKVQLKFKVSPTSGGLLAQGVELPAIIVESPDENNLDKDLDAAIDCYFKSFPAEVEKFILKDKEEIKTMDVSIQFALANEHNWNQFHKVLTEKLAWKQIQSYDRDMISYLSPRGKKLVIKKLNKMSVDYVFRILWYIGVDYTAFKKYYSE